MRIIGILLISLMIWGCSKSNQPTSDKLAEFNPFRQTVEKGIFIIDENGKGLAGARVLIGNSVGSPFTNNLLIASQSGYLEIPSEWTTPQNVTIFKTGYVSTTYANVSPGSLVIILKKEREVSRLELNGKINGFGDLKKDGFVDFALVIPAFTRESSLNFDIGSIISPEVDIIKVLGYSLQIPTNIFLPKQTENYGIISVTLDKAFYKIFFDNAGMYNISANRAKFHFKKVADKLKNGDNFFEAVNDIEFLSAQPHAVDIKSSKETKDLDSNQHMLTQKLNFDLNASNSSRMLFGISMFSNNGKLIATDIKMRENSKTQTLSVPNTNAEKHILLAQTQKAQGNKLSSAMSTALTSPDNLKQTIMLDEVVAPQGTATEITMQVPTPKANIKAFATRVTLSDVELIPMNGYTLEKKSILWEAYAPGWIDRAEVPASVHSFVSNSKRWDVVYFGIQSTENKVFTGPQSLEYATHAVQNSLEL